MSKKNQDQVSIVPYTKKERRRLRAKHTLKEHQSVTPLSISYALIPLLFTRKTARSSVPTMKARSGGEREKLSMRDP